MGGGFFTVAIPSLTEHYNVINENRLIRSFPLNLTKIKGVKKRYSRDYKELIASKMKGVVKRSFIKKYGQNIILHKSILLPQTYRSLINLEKKTSSAF